MEHLNVLLVEDNVDEQQAIKMLLENNGLNVIAVVDAYREAMNVILHENVDLLILDIFLNERPEGITIAETMCAMSEKQKPFIFLTSSQDRMIFEQAKLTKPYAYIVKPYNELELIYAVEQAIERFYEQPNTLTIEDGNAVVGDEYLFIKKGKSLKKVHVSEIIYIEVEDKYCNIITGKEKFVILISLIKILDFLSTTKFCRTHRNFIINTDKIVEIVPMDNLILLEGNHKATLSDKYKDMIKKIRTLR